ncbi:MAG: cytochrome P450 [Planctomycetes bacterium]|nr:cytochrome P450 [Planctomycetota bacterium]
MIVKTYSPPGPKGHWLIGHLPLYRRGALDFMTRCAREHGDVVALRFAHRRILLVSHPDLIEQVLVTQNSCFQKHFALRLNPLLLGKGLLTSEGDFWLRQRRLVQPAFNRSRLATYAPAVVAATHRLLNEWRPGEQRDIHIDMRRLALDIAAKTLFDADAGAEDAQDISRALEVSGENFMARFQGTIPWPSWLPTPANLRLRRAVRRLDAILFGFIRQRRAQGQSSTVNGGGRGDLLSLLLRARDEEDGRGMSDRQVRDEAMTLFLAGHETTALALSWTWFLLAQNPKAEQKLFDECNAAVAHASASTNASPSFDDLARLPYTEAVLLEAMRLYPPAYVIGREATRDLTLGGFPLRKGQTVLMSQWVVQRDPRFFDEPDEFHPERWLDERTEKLPKFAYFPFGGGPRLCVGNTFAMMEMTLILATLAPRFRFTLAPGCIVRPAASFTLHPAPGIPARIARR